jgi:hypothetical protein
LAWVAFVSAFLVAVLEALLCAGMCGRTHPDNKREGGGAYIGSGAKGEPAGDEDDDPFADCCDATSAMCGCDDFSAAMGGTRDDPAAPDRMRRFKAHLVPAAAAALDAAAAIPGGRRLHVLLYMQPPEDGVDDAPKHLRRIDAMESVTSSAAFAVGLDATGAILSPRNARWRQGAHNDDDRAAGALLRTSLTDAEPDDGDEEDGQGGWSQSAPTPVHAWERYEIAPPKQNER